MAYVVMAHVVMANFQVTPMQIDTWNRDKMNISAAAERGSIFNHFSGAYRRRTPRG